MKQPSKKELLAENAKLKEQLEAGYTLLEKLAQKNQLLRDMILEPPNDEVWEGKVYLDRGDDRRKKKERRKP